MTQRRLCWHCRRRTPEAGFETCSICRRQIRGITRAKRLVRKRQGLCTRCGDRKPRKGRTTCQQCADKALQQSIVTQEERALAGMCTRCGQRERAPNLRTCRACLRAQKKRKRHSAKDSGTAARVAKWKAKQRAAGRCTTCGERAEINPATGNPYVRCQLHRDQDRARKQRRDTAG